MEGLVGPFTRIKPATSNGATTVEASMTLAQLAVSRRVLVCAVVAILLTIALAEAGCQQRQKESKSKEDLSWSSPSGVETSGSFDLPGPGTINGSFVVYVDMFSKNPTSKGIFEFPVPQSDHLPSNSDIRQVTSGGVDTHPSVSNDGEKIVYSHYQNDPRPISKSSGIFVVPTAGGQPRQITPQSWMTETGWTPLLNLKPENPLIHRDCLEPSYSPDDGTICFVISDSSRDGQNSRTALATVSADGGEAPRILLLNPSGLGESISHPKYSPDGQYIYYCCGRSIEKVPFVGGSPTQIVRSLDGNYEAFDFTKQPTGIVTLLFTGLSKQSTMHTEIMLMGMDGSNIREVYSQPGDLADISVSADGKQMIIDGGAAGTIAILDLGNSTIWRLPVAESAEACFGRKLSK